MTYTEDHSIAETVAKIVNDFPFGGVGLGLAIGEAILAERERCAAIVNGWHKDNMDQPLTFSGGKMRLTAVAEIARAIREGEALGKVADG